MVVTNDIQETIKRVFSWIRKEENEVITTMRIYGSRLFFFLLTSKDVYSSLPLFPNTFALTLKLHNIVSIFNNVHDFMTAPLSNLLEKNLCHQCKALQ